MENVYDVLQHRGFIQQVTDPEPLRELLASHRVTFYVGFDPTAESLHAGSLLPIMAMANLQRHGHKPIVVIGGGTAMVGDPSGKTEMRKMMSRERIDSNAREMRLQLARYLDLSEGNAIVVNNYDWLGNLNYIEFLRDIGVHFSVNKMLTFEAYKKRMETGLSFLEFNYQLLQAFDFLVLNRDYDCRLQMGGDDQWANILAGTDLIRRMERKDVYGLTFPLLVTASGAKMGKTESGALWLDAQKTAPYDFYQYWINVADDDLVKFLFYFTFLPTYEIEDVKKRQGVELNAAKTILAYEATRIAHGEDVAKKVFSSSMAAFGTRKIPDSILPSSTIPRGSVTADEAGLPIARKDYSFFEARPKIISVLTDLGLTSSKQEAKRLVQQGGVYLNDVRVSDTEMALAENDVINNRIVLRVGKKKYFYLKFE